MTQISDERLAELLSINQVRQERPLCEYDAAIAEDTAAALLELQEFRQVRRVLREMSKEREQFSCSPEKP